MNIAFGLFFLMLAMGWFCKAYANTNKDIFKFIANIIIGFAYFLLSLLYIFAITF